jgi:hypothetical protein
VTREFNERIQKIIDRYPELEEVSDEALEALALGAGLNVVEGIEERMHNQSEGSRERLDNLLEQEGDTDE